MYRCPSCGANMRYDIKLKMLHCDYCDKSILVNNHPKQQKDAKEATYDTTVYQCPQCGGEITSTENAATEFCTYCGMTVVLEGHLSKEKKPDYIIPFQIDKEDCKKIYKQKTQHIWCLPNEFKDEEYLNRFIPIYMPYIVYNALQTGINYFTGENQHGNYLYKYVIGVDVENTYNWINYDASSLFYDELSQGINDYTIEKRLPFSTGYLAGFYADNPDVPTNTYEDEVNQYIEKEALKYIERNVSDDKGASISNWTLKTNDISAKYRLDTDYDENHDNAQNKTKKRNKTIEFDNQIVQAKTSLFPVWFLTWRNKDKVAYSVVNGETGSCAGDFPVSMKKYVLFSLLFSIPFMILYLLFATYSPDMTINIATCFSVFILILSGKILVGQINKDMHLKDKGMQSQEIEQEKAFAFLPVIGWTLVILAIIGTILRYTTVSENGFIQYITAVIALFIILLSCFKFIKLSKATEDKSILLFILLLIPFYIVSCLIQIINPVSDIYYYIGILAILIGTCIEFAFLIKRYNQSCTLPIPVYHERSPK